MSRNESARLHGRCIFNLPQGSAVWEHCVVCIMTGKAITHASLWGSHIITREAIVHAHLLYHNSWCHYPSSPVVLLYHHPRSHYPSSPVGLSHHRPWSYCLCLLVGSSHYHPWCHYPCSPVGLLHHHLICASCEVAGLFNFFDSEYLGCGFHFQFQPRDSDLLLGALWSLMSLALWGACLSVLWLVCRIPGAHHHQYAMSEFHWRLETENPSTVCINLIHITETWNVPLCFLMLYFLPSSQHTVAERIFLWCG